MVLVTLFFVGFLILVLLRFPVAIALGVAIMLFMIITGTPLGLLPSRIFAGIDKFAFLAIPFFILAGELMCVSGVLERLLDFARLCVGRLKGGLLHVNIMLSMLFGGINGSAVADTAAVGAMLIPSTVKEYGNAPFVAAVTACSSVVGPIIPPSLPFILYALASQNVTISGLFMAGVIPGIMLGVGMMIITYFVVKKRNYPRDTTKYSWREILRILGRFVIAMFLPGIMVGGVISGIFTATESGCIAVVYAIFVGFVITRELTIKKMYEAFVRAAVVSSVVLVIVAVANVTVWWFTTSGVPMKLANFIMNLTKDQENFLVIISILFFVLGFVMDGGALIIMLVPILAPIGALIGVNPIHMGLVTIIVITLALVTPPVAMSLFIASSISRVPVERIFQAAIPLLCLNLVVTLIIIFWPELYMWVPFSLGFTE